MDGDVSRHGHKWPIAGEENTAPIPAGIVHYMRLRCAQLVAVCRDGSSHGREQHCEPVAEQVIRRRGSLSISTYDSLETDEEVQSYVRPSNREDIKQ